MSAVSVSDTSREDERLAALDRYDVLDTPSEEAFDRITRLVCRIFDVPMSTVTFVDAHRQWLKSKQGRDDTEGSRSTSFCHMAIVQGAPLIIESAADDERVKDSHYVTGPAHVRFYAGIPLHTRDGHGIGTLCAVDTKPRTFGPRDVELLSDLARVVMDELELRALATTDSLTGALSRRAFREEASRAIALAQRHHYEMSLVMMDVDHFKQVNDTYGHAVGDRVLSDLATTCRATLRKSDVFGRLGGEEFAILLPHTPASTALEVADKLRATIARMKIPANGTDIGVTASFGISGLTRTAATVDDLLRRADEALYAAKADGRNRCHVWQQPVEPTIAPDVRRRVLKAGRITFNSGHSTVDCTIRSLSETGAGIDVLSTSGIPERFKLHILADDVLRGCQVTTRSDRHFEVEFPWRDAAQPDAA